MSFVSMRLLTFFLPFTLLTHAAASPLVGQPADGGTTSADKTILLTSSQQGNDFSTILKATASRLRVAIVIEGVPLHQKLSDEEAQRLREAATVDELVQCLCDDYDLYAPQKPRNAKVRGLKKRYTDPRDLPGITLEEYAQILKDASRMIAPYQPQPPIEWNGAFISEFARTITPEQMEKLKAGQLAVASLTAEQKQQIFRLTLHGYTGHMMNDLKAPAVHFKNLEQSSLLSKRLSGVFWLGYVGYGKEEVKDAFTPLFTPDVQMTDATEALRPADKEMLKQLDWKKAETIGAIVNRLNRERKGDEQYSVDPILADKPITVAGIEDASPRSLLQEIAEVYGLRTLTVSTQPSEIQIVRRRVVLPTNISELSQQIISICPDPLLQAYHMVDEQVGDKDFPKKSMDNILRANVLEGVARVKLLDIYQAAVKAKAESGGKDETAEGRSIRKMSIIGRSALGLVVMHNFLSGLHSAFGTNAPPVVLHWEDAILIGGPRGEGKDRKFDLSIQYTVENPDGSKDTNTGGVGGVPYPGP